MTCRDLLCLFEDPPGNVPESNLRKFCRINTERLLLVLEKAPLCMSVAGSVSGQRADEPTEERAEQHDTGHAENLPDSLTRSAGALDRHLPQIITSLLL